MRIRTLPSLAIFTGSYLPLSLILLVQDVNLEQIDIEYFSELGSIEILLRAVFKNPFASISFLALTFSCFIFTLFVFSLVKGGREIKTLEVKHVPSDLLNYVFPYVVSFMALSYQEMEKIIGFIIFLGWLFLLSHLSGRVLYNPVLIVFGWKLYEVKYTSPKGGRVFTQFALSKVELEPQEIYRMYHLQDVMIIHETEEHHGTACGS